MRYINLIGIYMERVICSDYKQNILEGYRDYFKSMKIDLMEDYFTNFVPMGQDSMLMRVIKLNTQIKERYHDISIILTHLQHWISYEAFNKMLIGNQITDNIELNVFWGLYTCHSFVSFRNNIPSINIALEKFLDSNDIEKEIRCTIVHELTHVIRVLNNKFENTTLGNNLVEEGVACYTAMNLLNEYRENIIFPAVISNDNISKVRSYYYRNLNQCDTELIDCLMSKGHIGRGILPGSGYYIGYYIVDEYVGINNLTIYELLNCNNNELLFRFVGGY